MTIDRKQLIALLAQKTGLDNEQIEEQLSELIVKVKKAAERGKSFKIQEFGTFSIEDDMLHFEPADELKTEINHKYTGMEPIELIGAFGSDEPSDTEKQTEPEQKKKPEAEPETEEESVWGLDLTEQEEMEEDVPPEEKPEKEKAAAPSDTTPEKKEPAPSEESEPPSPVTGEDEPVSPPVEPPEEKEIKTPADTPGEEDLPAPPPGKPEEPKEPAPADRSKKEKPQPGSEPRKEQKPKPKFQFDANQKKSKTKPASRPAAKRKTAAGKKISPKQRKEEKDTIGTILTVFVIVAALAATGWLVYDLGLIPGFSDGDSETVVQQQPPPPPPQESQPEQPQQSGNINETTSEPEGGRENQPAGEQEQTAVPEQEQPAEEQAEQQNQPSPPVYGLKGELNPAANDGYTIIVHSLRSESKARGIRNDLRNEGYRIIFTEAVVRGTTYWRIGIGQFETVSKARDAADNLREPFKNNHFIKKIR